MYGDPQGPPSSPIWFREVSIGHWTLNQTPNTAANIEYATPLHQYSAHEYELSLLTINWLNIYYYNRAFVGEP